MNIKLYKSVYFNLQFLQIVLLASKMKSFVILEFDSVPTHWLCHMPCPTCPSSTRAQQCGVHEHLRRRVPRKIQMSCSPLVSRGHLPPANDCPGSCSTPASRRCSHLTGTPPGGCSSSSNRRCSKPSEQDCSPSASRGQASCPCACSPTRGTLVGPFAPGEHGPSGVAYSQHLGPPLSRSSPLTSTTTLSSLLC